MNHPTRSYVPRPRPSVAGTRLFVGDEIDSFAQDIARFRSDLVPEAVFLENRLRHGVYGQRQDGVHMMRSKLPLGLLSPEQLEAFADLTETYASGIAHLTTRQDIQVHFVTLERSPDVMRVLADAEMTSREACGNVVRNVCASPLAGVLPGEAFDVTPYGMALAAFLLRLPQGQSLGRKFKITLTGSDDRRFDQTSLHDLGLTARIRDGVRGFRVVVGGGLGAVPHEARVLSEFLPVDELFDTARAVLSVFSKHGEKKRRARARMKFLVAEWGIERFREEVFRVRDTLPHVDPDTIVDHSGIWTDRPLHPPGATDVDIPEGAERWWRTSVVPQDEPGYVAVQVRVPRGDLTPEQLRGLAVLLRAHVGDCMRIGVDQSLWFRNVSTDQVWDVRDALVSLGLGEAGAGGLEDPVTCPGADTCKLGITTPRALARSLEAELADIAKDPRLEHLRLNISGCPNACAQHHIADIGLFGAARTVQGQTAPHFMLLLGGLQGGAHHAELGDGFGTTVIKLPAPHIGEAVRRLTSAYLERGEEGEPFGRFARRLGRAWAKELLSDLKVLPTPDEDPTYYREHGRDAGFRVVRGTGECAGAVVLQPDLLLMEADRFSDRATGLLEDGAGADRIRPEALAAIDRAARAILSTQGLDDVAPKDLVDRFRTVVYEPGIVFEGVGHYALQALTEPAEDVVGDRLRRLVVETGLFVEEAHSLVGRLLNPGEVSR
jgi:sulfite reductase (ferredoxin)